MVNKRVVAVLEPKMVIGILIRFGIGVGKFSNFTGLSWGGWKDKILVLSFL